MPAPFVIYLAGNSIADTIRTSGGSGMLGYE